MISYKSPQTGKTVVLSGFLRVNGIYHCLNSIKDAKACHDALVELIRFLDENPRAGITVQNNSRQKRLPVNQVTDPTTLKASRATLGVYHAGQVKTIFYVINALRSGPMTSKELIEAISKRGWTTLDKSPARSIGSRLKPYTLYVKYNRAERKWYLNMANKPDILAFINRLNDEEKRRLFL